MTADTLRMDGDDASDLVIEVERSFGIWLGEDLSGVVTVGDLHAAVLRELGEPEGTVCATSRVFYRIRALIGAEGARPDTKLASIWSGSARSLRDTIRNASGWEDPGLFIGWFGCSALLVSVIMAIVLGWWISGLLVPFLLAIGALACWLDSGSLEGDWQTLGSISRAYAAYNQAALAADGARLSPATVWHALVTLIAKYGMDRAAIRMESRLCG